MRTLLLPLLVLLYATSASAQDVGLPLGTVPAALVMEDLEGNAVDLKRSMGKRPVLIEFWAEWCEQCEALMPKLEAAAKQHAGKVDVLIVAVGVNQTKRSVRRHLEKHPMPGTLVFDAGGKAVRAFQAPATSYVVILDAKGRVVYTGIGPDQQLGAALGRALAAK